jgi:hypothetical protein
VADSGDFRAITDVAALITGLSGEGELTLRAGKKRYCRVVTTE